MEAEFDTEERQFCADALKTLFDNMKDEVDVNVFMEVCSLIRLRKNISIILHTTYLIFFNAAHVRSRI